MENKIIAYIALGSNIGDRLDFLNQARELLNQNSKIDIVKKSKIYETEPWPKNDCDKEHPKNEAGQKWFLNQVLEIETSLSPQDLLKLAKKIEKKLGRIQRSHWSKREIDIDILLYANQIIDSPDLQIPHRHIEDRLFVLKPLVEIVPQLKDPITNRLFSTILKKLEIKDEHRVIEFL